MCKTFFLVPEHSSNFNLRKKQNKKKLCPCEQYGSFKVLLTIDRQRYVSNKLNI